MRYFEIYRDILREIERYWDIDRIWYILIDYKTDANETWYQIFSKLCNQFAPLHPCSASRNFFKKRITIYFIYHTFKKEKINIIFLKMSLLSFLNAFFLYLHKACAASKQEQARVQNCEFLAPVMKRKEILKTSFYKFPCGEEK